MRSVRVNGKAIENCDKKMIFFNQIKFGQVEVIFYLWQLFEKKGGKRDIKVGFVFCRKLF